MPDQSMGQPKRRRRRRRRNRSEFRAKVSLEGHRGRNCCLERALARWPPVRALAAQGRNSRDRWPPLRDVDEDKVDSIGRRLARATANFRPQSSLVCALCWLSQTWSPLARQTGRQTRRAIQFDLCEPLLPVLRQTTQHHETTWPAPHRNCSRASQQQRRGGRTGGQQCAPVKRVSEFALAHTAANWKPCLPCCQQQLSDAERAKSLVRLSARLFATTTTTTTTTNYYYYQCPPPPRTGPDSSERR